jgi:hypothetical protein
MKHTKEYKDFVDAFGSRADIILMYAFQKEKGHLDETKRTKILGTLRTGKNDSRGLGIRSETSKTVPTNKPTVG